MKYIRFLFFVLLLFIQCDLALAQGKGTGHLQKTPYTEKVYLHIQKHLFSPGDDLWYKALLINGATNQLATRGSKNLYVEIISPGGKLIGSHVLRLEKGMGNGDFKFPDTLSSGNYLIRAYTPWMLNFGSNFVFEKEVYVKNIFQNKAETGVMNVDSAFVDFFPEGGNLVSDVWCNVAFKAVNQKGIGCLAKGVITEVWGDTVCRFESSNKGMGTFRFIPANGHVYIASGTAGRFEFTQQLPFALNEGFAMTVASAPTDSIVQICIATNNWTIARMRREPFYLGIENRGKTFSRNKLAVVNVNTRVHLLRKVLRPGINRITLYDSLNNAYCERLVYCESEDRVTVHIGTDKQKYKPRDSIAITIRVTDRNNNPVKAYLSVAAVDQGATRQAKFDIRSYLNLESEIKGAIEEPLSYFDTTNTERYQQLDLLLLTQGWRGFVWKGMLDSVFRPKYGIDSTITISGNVVSKIFGKPITGLNISSVLFGAKRNGFLVSSTDSAGNFYFDNIVFYGKKRLVISARDVNNYLRGDLVTDSVFRRYLPIKLPDYYRNEFVKLTANDLVEQFKKRRSITLDTFELNQVIIGSGDQNVYEFIIGPADYEYYDINTFLADKIPWAVLGEPTNYNRMANMGTVSTDFSVRFKLKGEYHRPLYWYRDVNLDEYFNLKYPRNSIAEMLDIKQMTKVIAHRSPALVEIWINPNELKTLKLAWKNKKIYGYHQQRVFYAPRYNHGNYGGKKNDERTTIHWEPNICTDDNGTAVVGFYNADKAASIGVSVEGLSATGTVVAGSCTYKVEE